jgi:dCMP deaminase
MEYVKQITELTNKLESRLDWDSYFMSMAILISSRSACDRLHVGCILVKDTRVISVGYNGFLPKAPHNSIMKDGHEQATVHAEQNAITDCAKRGISCIDSTAYITHYPCINCSKILAASGIKEVIYLNDYRNDPISIEILDSANVSIKKYI